MHLYGNIQKVDVEQRIVAGYASTEAVDAHGEIVTKAAIEAALDVQKRQANDGDLVAALGAMSEEDRALLLIKAAQRLPRPATMARSTE